jgi:two-component system cell cycle sensor histidine kinase/response regulator CckA
LILATKAVQPQGAQNGPRSAIVLAMAPTTSTKGTILVAEDDGEVRKLVASILQERGFHVIVANDAKQALKRARDYEGEISLLLTDVEMGHLDGFDLRERLLQERPKVKVVVMSGRLDEEFEPHDFPVVRKPFSVEHLVSVIQSQLD